MKTVINTLKLHIQNHEVAMIEKTLLIVYSNQTADERGTGSTRHENGRGFNSRDAGFGTSIAEQVLRGRVLSEGQIKAAANMLVKYAAQALDSNVSFAGEVEAYVPVVSEELKEVKEKINRDVAFARDLLVIARENGLISESDINPVNSLLSVNERGWSWSPKQIAFVKSLASRYAEKVVNV